MIRGGSPSVDGEGGVGRVGLAAGVWGWTGAAWIGLAWTWFRAARKKAAWALRADEVSPPDGGRVWGKPGRIALIANR